MTEPSKRSWPWKKKLQDKAALAPESSESSPRASPHNSKFFDEQDVSKILSDHARVSDEAMTQWQQSDSKLKQLSDKLHTAQTELTTKDILVKQHAKVAEEAVTGWEKAEAEAAALKQQLGKITHQKLATEDRVSHLDGALKECMRQLRHVREEQEQKIHETIVKKTREYDNLRQEMEARLAVVGHDLEDARSEALNCRNDAHATFILLEESRKLFAELNDSKVRSEAEVRILQGQLDSLEKENLDVKYELQILRKELEIRNEERAYDRKVTENAGKNQVENANKIAKLEAECHRLRLLMRKKLPGPAALAQMKIEVESLDSTNHGFDSRRKSLGVGRSARSVSRESMRLLDSPKEASCDGFLERSRPDREAGVLAERHVGMDDELKMLKEALLRRDQELQVSRLMCAKTASKLSKVEEQLEITLKRCKRESIGVDGFSRKEGLRVGDETVDSWDAASALLAELDQFKVANNRGPSVGQLDLMDDFAEMERLAMVTGEAQPDEGKACNKEELSEQSFIDVATSLEDKLIAKEKELAEANRLRKEVSEQLLLAEERVAALQARNSDNEAVLVSLQAKLDRFCDKQGEDEVLKDHNITKELEDLVEAQSISLRAGAVNEATLYGLEEGTQNSVDTENGVQRYSSSRSTSEMKYGENEDQVSVVSDVESKSISFGSDLLLAAVRRVVLVVAALVQASGSDKEISSTFELGFQNDLVPEIQVHNFMQWKHPNLQSGMQSLLAVSNNLLQGKTDVVEFLTELSATLNYLVSLHPRNVDQFVGRIEGTTDFSSGQENSDVLWKIGLEKVHLESQVRSLQENSHKSNIGQVEGQEVAPSKSFNSNNTESLEEENFHVKLGGSNGYSNERQTRSISKCELDRDMLLFYGKVSDLEGELLGERLRHQEVVLKYLDLQQQMHSQGAGSASSAGSITRDCSESEWGGSHNQYQARDLGLGDVQVGKDGHTQSATEKLAECQRSILDLGKQLKNLASPSSSDSLTALLESDTDCSVDRLGPYLDQNRSQSQARDKTSESCSSGHVIDDSNYARLPLDIKSDSIPGRDYPPCSLLLDWSGGLCLGTPLICKDIGSQLIPDVTKADQTLSGNEKDKESESGNHVRSC